MSARAVIVEVGGPEDSVGTAELLERVAALDLSASAGRMRRRCSSRWPSRLTAWAGSLTTFISLVGGSGCLLGRVAVHDVAGAGAVVSDPAGHELLAHLAATAGSLLLVLVDVAGRDDLIARLEPRVGPLGHAVGQDHVAEDG